MAVELYFSLFHFEWSGVEWWWWWRCCLLICDILCFMIPGVWIGLHIMYCTWIITIENNSSLIRQIWKKMHSYLQQLPGGNSSYKLFIFLGLISGFVSFCHQFYQINMFGCVSLHWPNRRRLTPGGRRRWGTKWLTPVGGSSPRGWSTSESWMNRPKSSTTSSKIPAYSLVGSHSVWCNR